MLKIIAFYLPQFYQCEENNMWWGKGYTEWDLVKNARKLFDGHQQPNAPLNEYNLLDINSLEYQAKLAKDYNIFGFCIYHYWFEGKKLLHKPLELLQQHPEIDIKYCLCWANETWTDVWRNPNPKTLLNQTYGGVDDWTEHFNYLEKFIKDSRYIRIDNKPLIVIYRPGQITDLENMLDYWNKLSIERGIGELCFAYYHCEYYFDKNKKDIFDYQIEMQPTLTKELYDTQAFKNKIDWLKDLDKKDFFRRNNISRPLIIRSYDKAWEQILSLKPLSDKSIPGSFVNWDNSPRYNERSDFYIGFTPDKFEKYFYQQIENAINIYHCDYLFLFAWNEWSEGGYLEPDIRDGYRRLTAVKNAYEKYYSQHPENT